jgi:NAD(P)-dependent dehydrogenase (short-subunit alcohol dehydrogenase family)
MQEWLRSVQPMPRAGTPEEMAPVAVFLSSPGADFVTGQILSADGGVSAGLVWPFTPAS